MRRWGAVLTGLLVSAACALTGITVASTAEAVGDPVIKAAGDIACQPPFTRGTKCRDDLTAAKLADATAVLTLGDNQYNCGRLDAYQASYAKTWGVYKSKTYPIPGGDEYSGADCTTPGAEGYFTYFGSQARQGTCTKACKGWYSYDIGNWHVVALNTACNESGVGGCSASSAQVQWLKSNLAASTKKCKLAQMHQPYWANGKTVRKYKAIVDALYAGGVDVLLAGNSHLYARYKPQDPNSKAVSNGIREFIVGTGGRSHSKLSTDPLPNLERANDTTFGVLKLTLGATSYSWEYQKAYGPTFTDTGSSACS